MPEHTLMTTLKFFAACLLLLVSAIASGAEQPPATPQGDAAGTSRQAAKHRATVGAYYFDGWAGRSERWKDDAAWAALNPPTHLTKRMLDEFADREPIWGWRDDSLEIIGGPAASRPAECLGYNASRTPMASSPWLFWLQRDGISRFRVLWDNQEVARCEIAAGQCEAYIP